VAIDNDCESFERKVVQALVHNRSISPVRRIWRESCGPFKPWLVPIVIRSVGQASDRDDAPTSAVEPFLGGAAC
jgi:hypothetical protein